jgi:thymidylate synthase (FAD)
MKVDLVAKTIGVGDYQDLPYPGIIAAIARHGELKEGVNGLIRYLVKNKHWSPLEHTYFTFKVETRRSISAQIMRHRSMTFQEWSLRYAEPLGFEEIDIRKEHPTNRQSSTDSFAPTIGYIPASDLIYNHLENTEMLYNDLIEAGVAKECARDILPLCTKTTIHITGNLRSMLAFINIRNDHHAQKEVRDISTAMGEELEKEVPEIFNRLNWREGMYM